MSLSRLSSLLSLLGHRDIDLTDESVMVISDEFLHMVCSLARAVNEALVLATVSKGVKCWVSRGHKRHHRRAMVSYIRLVLRFSKRFTGTAGSMIEI